MAPKFDVYAHVTDTIIAEMEAGTPPWRKPWTGSASGIALPTRHNGEELAIIKLARASERIMRICVCIMRLQLVDHARP